MPGNNFCILLDSALEDIMRGGILGLDQTHQKKKKKTICKEKERE